MNVSTVNSICPCGSGDVYEQCCGRLHQGEVIASSAEQLMRSRYSAYVKLLPQYLLDTWSTESRPEGINLDSDTCWVKLEVITATELQVEYIATFLQGVRCGYLHEISRFECQDGRYYYLDGELIDEPVIKISRNQLCPCGSGKKFKRCHADHA